MRWTCACVIGLLCVLSASAALVAQETLTLTTPVSQPSIVTWQVARIILDRSAWTIQVELTSNASGALVCVWNSAGLRCSTGFTNAAASTGQTLLIALNKANLSVTSLEKRLYNQLVTDGVFLGTVTGSPQ